MLQPDSKEITIGVDRPSMFVSLSCFKHNDQVADGTEGIGSCGELLRGIGSHDLFPDAPAPFLNS